MRQRACAGWLTRKLCHLLFATLSSVLLLLHARTGQAWSIPFGVLMVLGVVLVRGDVVLGWIMPAAQLARLFKSSEDKRPHGITYGVVGVVGAYLIGGAQIAAAATILLGITDFFAGLVGVYCGRHTLPYNRKKSWEGTLAGLAAGIGLMWFWPEARPLGIIMATTTSAVESLPSLIDDNFTCPVSAATVAVMSKLFIHG